MILYLAILWYLIGAGSFLFWYTKDEDFTFGEIWLMLLAGIIGPIAFLVGWGIHGKPLKMSEKILIKQRK